MKPRRIWLSEIEGKLLEGGRPTESLGRLRRIMDGQRGRTALVYTTGRSLKWTLNLVELGVLPAPDAIAPLLGTEIWFPDWQKPDPFYRELVRHKWNRDAVEYFGRKIPNLRPQGDEYQGPFKVSFHIDDHKKVYDLQRFFDDSYLCAKAVYSRGQCLDIIPTRAGTERAVQYLGRVWEVEPHNIYTSGDSGNHREISSNPGMSKVSGGDADIERACNGSMVRKTVSQLAGLLGSAEAFVFRPTG